MKLILSRKGFDSSSGGGPSPILPDGRLVSLPIPDPHSPLSFKDISFQGEALGSLVTGLSKGKIAAKAGAHLDPDLEAESVPRAPGWQPLFGQMGAAEGHLRGKKIGPGDVFVFFGWFRRVVREGRRWRYEKGAPDQHILFGWFQIEDIWRLGDGQPNLPDWAQSHPHAFGSRGKNNTLYVGRKELLLPGLKRKLPGCGQFKTLRPELVLTREGENRCNWALPKWFHPEGRANCLSYHERQDRWERKGDQVHLRSVARGQEFVLDTQAYPEAIPWLRSLLENESLVKTASACHQAGNGE